LNVYKRIGEINSENATATEYLGKIETVLSAKNLVRNLQDAIDLRPNMAAVVQRAGSPVVEFGPVGYSIKHLREVNQTFRNLGTSFQLDENLGRRSMFLAMAGMAINLGDVDGDQSVLHLLKRYIVLKTIQKASNNSGLAAVERHAKLTIKELRKAGDNNLLNVAEYEMFLPQQTHVDGRKSASLQEDLKIIEHEIWSKHTPKLLEQTEGYLGLRAGTIKNFAKEAFGGRWDIAENEDNKLEMNVMLGRTATHLNSFAGDMYSQIWHASSDIVEQYLASAETPGAMTDEALELMLKNRMEGTLKHYENTSTSMVAKSISHMFGSEANIDTIMRYGIKVAFASTKLIGNFTNLQTLHQTLNHSRKMVTFHELENIRKDLQQVAINTGNEDKIQELHNSINEIQARETKKSNLINQRLNYYMGFLQQETRNAIKQKAIMTSNTGESRSVFEAMLQENAAISAINKSYGLIHGKSMFDHNNHMEEFNRKEDVYEVLTSVSPDDAIQIDLDSSGNLKVDLMTGFLEGKGAQVWEHVVEPHLKAAAMQSEAAKKIFEKIQGTAEHKERMKIYLNELDEDTAMTGLLAAHSFWKEVFSHKQINDYKKAIMQSDASNYERARIDMDDRLKLVFLSEALRGGKLNQTAMDRALKDVIETFVTPTMDMTMLEQHGRMVDPTGHFSRTLQYAVTGYLKGQQVDGLFQALHRKDATHYQLLAEMEYELAEVVGLNPLANVDNPFIHGNGTAEQSRAMSEKYRVGRFDHSFYNALGGFLPMLVTGGIVGGGIAGGVLYGQSAEASEANNVQRASQPDAFRKIIEYGANLAASWDPAWILKNIQLAPGMSNREKLIEGLSFGAAASIGTLAANHVARNLSKVTGVTQVMLERGATAISTVAMMAAGALINNFVEASRAKDQQRKLQMETNVSEDLRMAQGIAEAMSEIDSYASELGAPEDTQVLLYDENGDAIPTDFKLTEENINSGVTDEETNAISGNLGAVGDTETVTGAFSRPQDNFGRDYKKDEAAKRVAEEAKIYNNR
jgi:hypothetical protein